MFLVGIFQWWYDDGLRQHIKRGFLGVLKTADFFSIGLLFRTLFNPFRQISAEKVQGGLPEQLNALFDRLFSRAIGATVRMIFIFIGLGALIVRSLLTIINITAWVILPFFPIIGIILWQLGVAL